jgi:hypothetical protein
MNFGYGCDITEKYLVKIYDDLQQEQLRLMNGIKNNSEDNSKQHSAVTKQISCINSINLNILKLNNIRKKMVDT